MNRMTRNDGSGCWFWVVILLSSLTASTSQASLSPGLGIKMGNMRLSPFAEVGIGYDDNVQVSQPESLPVLPDGRFQGQGGGGSGDYFSQYTAGFGLSRVLASEWELRFRSWYDTRVYSVEHLNDNDTKTAEGSARYLPASDLYTVTLSGKVRQATDMERVPSSANLTMMGDTGLPYLEERDDSLERTTVDGSGNLSLRPQERTSFSLSAAGSTVDYTDRQLFDYWQWSANGDAGYRYSAKTSIYVEGEYELVNGDGLTRSVPVYAMRLGLRTMPSIKVDYHISVGAKTYEHATDTTGDTWKREWDIDFDGLLNWRISEKLGLFGNAWTDVSTAPQTQAPEDTRRTYAGQMGANYAFMKRMTAVGAVSYRLDAYDFPIDYGNNGTQRKSELWQLMGRVIAAPQTASFWKVFLESSYQLGDNDLSNYNDWTIMLGASAWY